MKADRSTARIHLHHVTAESLHDFAHSGELYVSADGDVSVDVGCAGLWFESPADFVGFLLKLGQMAAATPAIWSVMTGVSS